MDAIKNPFSPGAGSPPPELAGRDDLERKLEIAIERTRDRKAAKSAILTGLRGVGKTVLLDQMREYAEKRGYLALRLEAPEHRSLPALLLPELRKTLQKLSRHEKAKALAQRALSGIAGFVKAFKIKFSDIEVGLDFPAEAGLADNGNLEQDLQTLMELVGEVAQAAETAIVLMIDEVQYIKKEELAALITALHRLSQRQLPVIMISAGLPHITGKMGDAKTYAERLFDFPTLGPLTREAADQAIRNPIQSHGEQIEEEALALIYNHTKGYPYFLQEWGKQVWDIAKASPITTKDVLEAAKMAHVALDENFFRVRFDRLTPSERRYLRAMADCAGAPSYRTGDIAKQLGKDSNSLAPRRAKLIDKGMIWSPRHGITEFTVPMFDDFIKRAVPADG